MNWGKSIVLAFVLFAAFIAALVTLCMRQDVSLVTKEYYKEELAYQAQIDRITHTASLSEKPLIEMQEGQFLRITYKDFNSVQSGVLHLFRPSDPNLDRQYELRAGAEHQQYFSISGMEKGMYRARLTWTMDNEEFYLEKVINL